MNTSKTKELLKALGVTKDVIATLEDEETSKDFDAKEAAGAVKKGLQEELREALKNDPELNDSITKKVEGKFYGTLESAAKANGLSKEEIYEDDRLKSPKDILKMIADKNSSGKSEDLKTLQEQLREAKAEAKRLQEEEIPRVQKEAQAKADKEIVTMKMKGEFLNFPATDLVNKKHNDGVFNALMTGLNTKYDIRVGENGEPELYVKGKDLKANTSDGTKQLDIRDAIRQQLDEYDLTVKNNGGEGADESATEGQAAPAGTPKPNFSAGAKARALAMNEDIKNHSH